MIRSLLWSVFTRRIPGTFGRAMSSRMPAVDVRRKELESQMSITFKYSSPLVNERQFNFLRQQDEQLSSVLTRISQNICRAAEKKLRKLRKKKGSEDAESHPPLVVELWSQGSKIRDDTLSKDAFLAGAELVVGESRFKVRINPPSVTSLALPKSIMAGFAVRPRVEMEFCTLKDCSFIWMKETNSPGCEWEIVGRESSYVPGVIDIGHRLKVICGATGQPETERPLERQLEGTHTLEALSTSPVEGGPGLCPFDRRHAYTAEQTLPGEFRVMTYNVLADLYADSDFSRTTLFPDCPPYALAIDYRKQLFLKEITGYRSDIICLQEVDAKVYYGDLTATLEECGMNGVFTGKGRNLAEGLACFYNTNKFVKINEHSLVLGEALNTEPVFADFAEAVSKNEKLLARMIERTTAIQVVMLRSTEIPSFKVCVGNTHLYFHPDADHIRLLQVGMLMRQLEQMVAMEKLQEPDSHIAVVICGDFNSTPEYGVYQLMTTQYIPEDYPHWKSVPEEAVVGLSMSHSFALTSACGTPEYTNYTTGFNGCLDYIFSDLEKLKVKEVVPLPSHEDVTQYGALPSVTIPSDHLALVCKLEWNK